MRIVVLALALLASACSFSRVTLPPAPLKTAPLEERVRYANEQSPIGTRVIVSLRHGAPVGQTTDMLMLSSGLRVMHPMDLIPAVGDTSPTATYARAFDEALTRAQVTYLACLGLELLGTGLMMGEIVNRASPSTGSSSPGLGPMFWAGMGGVMLGSVGLLVGAVLGASAARERDSAFMTYPVDLKKNLALEDAPVAVPAP